MNSACANFVACRWIRLLFVGIVAFSVTGCGYTLTGGARVGANEANANYFQRLVGKNTTLRGAMNLASRIAPYIKTQEGPIYLMVQDSTSWKSGSLKLDGKFVSVTGVLQFHAWTTKYPHNYFYFDAETAQIKPE